MNFYRSNKLEHIWFMVVGIHVIGSSLTAFILGIPYGLVIFNSIFWIYCAYANRQKKAMFFLCALGWSVSLYLYNNMPIYYLVAFMLNVMILGYLLFLHYGSISLVIQENRIKRFQGKEMLAILPLTLLLLIMAGFVNAISMVFFENHVVDSLRNATNGLGYAVLALAIAPALVEEIVFRGIVFQRLGNGKKAIWISAILFALAHMNFNQICYAFVMGLFFALIFRATDNLSVTITIHFLFNLFNMITNAFIDTPLVNQIMGIQIAGYHPFDAQLIDMSGKIMMSAVMAGGIITIVAIILIGCILRFLLRDDLVKVYEGKEDGRVGILFYLGILVCMFIAFKMK